MKYNQTFFRITQLRSNRWNRQSYGGSEQLYGVAQETFFVENEFCSQDPYAYNPCSIYDAFLLPNQIANARQNEDSFAFQNPTCRTIC